MLMRPGPVKVSPNVEAKNTVPSSALPDSSPLWKTKAATKVVTALKNAAGRASKPSSSRIPPKNSESTAHHAKKLGKGKPILAISAMNQSCGPHRPSRGKNFSNTVHRKIPVARRISKSVVRLPRNEDSYPISSTFCDQSGYPPARVPKSFAAEGIGSLSNSRKSDLLIPPARHRRALPCASVTIVTGVLPML